MSSEASHPARRCVLIMLIGVAIPFVLGVDRFWPFFASNQTEWSRLIDERIQRSAGAIRGPKVLFIGGSNVTFGVRPRSLSQRLGVPVAAYGVNAGVGLDEIIRRAQRLIRAGDLVVLAPEIEHFRKPGVADAAIRGDWLGHFGNQAHDPIAEFPRRQWIAARARCRRVVTRSEAWAAQGLLDLRARSRGTRTSSGPTTVYDLRSIDADGYNTFPRPSLGRDKSAFAPVYAHQYDWANSIGAIGVRELAAVCRERGARLYVMPAVHITPVETARNARFIALSRERERDMEQFVESQGGRALLGPGSTALTKEYGYDTFYHLNDAGTAVIEELLVAALRGELARDGH